MELGGKLSTFISEDNPNEPGCSEKSDLDVPEFYPIKTSKYILLPALDAIKVPLEKAQILSENNLNLIELTSTKVVTRTVS